MKIDRDTVIDFLVAKGVDKNCPRCDKNEWNLSENPSPIAGLWGAREDQEFSLDSPIYPAAILTCTNCGFISLHAKNYIVTWAKQQKDGDDK